MFDRHPRIQRREFRDFQPLFMLINSLDIIDEATRRDFVCVQGPVWLRFNEATKGAQQRRITALFLGDEDNRFEELLLVGCDYVRRREQHCQRLWSGHALAALFDDRAVRHVCCGLAGRSVLTWQALAPWLQTDRAESIGGPAPFTHGADTGCRAHLPGQPEARAGRGRHALA